MFNFGISKESAVRNVKPQLKPWNIYDVKFVGCEVREFAGKKNPNETYKVLDIKFENEEGYFTVTKFFPKQGDDVRREVDAKNGGKRELASNFEELMNIVKQTAEILNPEGFKKMSELSSKFRSFDDVAKTLIAITDNYLGNKLFFSDYEEGRRAEYLKSKPTDMATAPAQVDSLMATDDIGDLPAGDDELDLDNLL